MNFVFSFLAGLLTTLSPCVLPVLPFVTASSLNKSKWGPLFLAFGLLLSFVSVSLLVSSSGAVLGLEPGVIRKVSGVLLVVSGLLFLSQPFADWFASKISFISGKANSLTRSSQNHALFAEFVNGVLLGAVWTPCSGPSLGAALGLAAQEGQLSQAALVLLAFGLGSVLPLLLFAYGARHIIGTLKSNANNIQYIKKFFGVLIIVFGILIIFELDRRVEAALTNLIPDTWLNFVTRF